jgi:murein DD-endopeptidase MepM/ murein hydrolase activator NlpD
MRKVYGKGFIGAAVAAAMLALLLAACGTRPDGPAPVVSGEPVAPVEPESVKVRPGQTLSGIAHAYHVSMQIIAEANHLAPPYHIEVGRTLIIPQTGQSAVPLTSASVSRAPPPKSEEVAASTRPTGVPLERTAEPPAVSAPTVAAEPPRADVKPGAASPASTPTAEPPVATPAARTPASDGGTFLWPVRGHVLGAYGSGRDGTRNDGINIAAPRGAAVEAADGGVVAYTGNELRGYGNLILVKHPNGWISAYAHCDSILVKRGDKVTRGQTIARVGSSGNVTEPQLHFELRRGNRAVDPREFLAPLPTAGTDRSSPPG